MTIRKKLDWKAWLYGLVGGSIGGGATAATSIPVGQVFGASDFTPRQLLSVFAGAALVSALMYLKQSPMPKEIEVDEP